MGERTRRGAALLAAMGGLLVGACGGFLGLGALAADDGDATAAAPATGVGEVDGVLAELGEVTYGKRCASCHGVDARGHGPVAKALRTPPSDLTKIAARREGHFPEGEIARFIDGRFEVTPHGTREMPVWGERLAADVPDARLAEEISRGKIVGLVEYLKSIQELP